MKKIPIILIGLFLNISLFSHPWKPSHYVIIDTDAGIDDIRAITMLLASPDVRVLAITVSSGSLNINSGYIKVRSLLNSFYHEGIQVGINRRSDFLSPDYKTAYDALWGDEKDLDSKDAPDCIALIKNILSADENKVSFLCLGSLSTANMAMNELPAFKEKVTEIIWSVNENGFSNGFNYKIDVPAADKVMKAGLPVRLVKNIKEEIFFDEKLISSISDIQTVYAEKISDFFRSVNTIQHNYIYSGNDEMIPLYLHYPELFQNTIKENISESAPSDITSLREKSLKILAGETVPKNQVIKEFPVDPAFYFPDIEPSVTGIIKKYGSDEWISGVIANELHRHLGTYAIIGVKMGIRAREYFNTGVDEFSAVSFAGSTPPLSCMNDGIQVSTGSTPGHGLLTVNNDLPSLPSVIFTYMNRKIRLTLKPELTEKISSELKEINFIYGLDSNIYWELVRKNTIKYWLSLDRHEIFDIEEIM